MDKIQRMFINNLSQNHRKDVVLLYYYEKFS